MSRPQAKSYRKKAAAAAAASSSRHHGKAQHGGHGRPPRWPSRVMNGFRKMLVGFFSFPPRPLTVTFSIDVDRAGGGGGGSGGGDHVPKRSSCSSNLQPVSGGDHVPKRSSCSSNLQPVNAHYDEAIADCVEFFHKSARVDVRSRPHF